MATLLKVLNNLADIKPAGGVALRVRTQDAQKAKAWDLWLDCLSEREIAAQTGIDDATTHRWIDASKTADAANEAPPASRQHFDVWQFAPNHRGKPRSKPRPTRNGEGLAHSVLEISNGASAPRRSKV